MPAKKRKSAVTSSSKKPSTKAIRKANKVTRWVTSGTTAKAKKAKQGKKIRNAKKPLKTNVWDAPTVLAEVAHITGFGASTLSNDDRIATRVKRTVVAPAAIAAIQPLTTTTIETNESLELHDDLNVESSSPALFQALTTFVVAQQGLPVLATDLAKAHTVQDCVDMSYQRVNQRTWRDRADIQAQVAPWFKTGNTVPPDSAKFSKLGFTPGYVYALAAHADYLIEPYDGRSISSMQVDRMATVGDFIDAVDAHINGRTW